MLSRILLSLAMSVLAIGCASTKATFQVQVMNMTDQPISVGLVKEASRAAIAEYGRPPVEPGWLAPEDINDPQLSSRHWGTLIPPQQSATLGPATGDFPQGLLAYLRVYVGDKTLNELLAVNRNDPDRVDIPLWPGVSSYIILMRNGKLIAAPAAAPPPSGITTRP